MDDGTAQYVMTYHTLLACVSSAIAAWSPFTIVQVLAGWSGTAGSLTRHIPLLVILCMWCLDSQDVFETYEDMDCPTSTQLLQLLQRHSTDREC